MTRIPSADTGFPRLLDPDPEAIAARAMLLATQLRITRPDTWRDDVVRGAIRDLERAITQLRERSISQVAERIDRDDENDRHMAETEPDPDRRSMIDLAYGRRSAWLTEAMPDEPVSATDALRDGHDWPTRHDDA